MSSPHHSPSSLPLNSSLYIHQPASLSCPLPSQVPATPLSPHSHTELESRLHELTESLIQKQTTLEALSSDKNSLKLQLERTEVGASLVAPFYLVSLECTPSLISAVTAVSLYSSTQSLCIYLQFDYFTCTYSYIILYIRIYALFIVLWCMTHGFTLTLSVSQCSLSHVLQYLFCSIHVPCRVSC